LVWNSEGNRQLIIPVYGWGSSVKMDLKRIGLELGNGSAAVSVVAFRFCKR
jgi:hypothetical protein